MQKALEPEGRNGSAQYDVLEAMAYIEQGLVDSALSGWFEGPVAETYPGEVGSTINIKAAIEAARRGLEADGDEGIKVEYLPRNICALVGELAEACLGVCGGAAGAATRGAVADVSTAVAACGDMAREWTAGDGTVYTATREADGIRLARNGASVLLVADERIADMAFFDDAVLVVLVDAGGAFLATVEYAGLEYAGCMRVGYMRARELPHSGVVCGNGRRGRRTCVVCGGGRAVVVDMEGDEG